MNTEMSNESKTKAKFKCDQCKRSFSYKGFLKHHLLCHTKPKDMSRCSICIKEFRFKQSLKLHLNPHEGEKDFKCN